MMEAGSWEVLKKEASQRREQKTNRAQMRVVTGFELGEVKPTLE